MSKLQERTNNAINTFTSMIQSGNFPEQVAKASLLTIHSDAPAAKWSAGNQLLMLMNVTSDARGYRQWQAVGRQVKKGAKALYIMSPRTVTREVENDKGEKEKRTFIRGFGFTPVFRIEDTEGDPLPSYDPPKLPPLIDVARALGVSVKYAPSAGSYGGYYKPSSKDIVLCTHEERVFFHELAHAAHDHIGKLRQNESATYKVNEIVAETAAAAISILYGYTGMEAYSKDYIAGWSQTRDDKEATLREIMKYVGEVRDVVTLILTLDERIKEGVA